MSKLQLRYEGNPILKQGVEVLKVRHRQIVVTGLDVQWAPIRFKLKGWAAIAVQHEVDHLDGVTIR